MPELPEIEVARQKLEPVLKGKVIKEVRGNVPKMVWPRFPKFGRILKGQKIKRLGRRAKTLIVELSGGWCLVIHFKLTGQLVYRWKGKKLLMVGHPMETVDTVPNKFTHLTFWFKDGSILYFNDLRKFAYAKLFQTCEIDKITEEKFGVEPLSPAFTFTKFTDLMKSRPKSLVKQFLMDQTLIAGIGNIYSDEILFFARVRPTRKIKSLTKSDSQKLFQGIKKILRRAVAKGSTSYNTYLHQKERQTNYNPYLRAYQREGEKCVRKDGGVIKRVKIGGRSAHFCPVCQK